MIYIVDANRSEGQMPCNVIINKIDNEEGRVLSHTILRSTNFGNLTNQVIELIEKEKPDQVIIDNRGVGTVVNDQFADALENKKCTFKVDSKGCVTYLQNEKTIQSNLNNTAKEKSHLVIIVNPHQLDENIKIFKALIGDATLVVRDQNMAKLSTSTHLITFVSYTNKDAIRSFRGDYVLNLTMNHDVEFIDLIRNMGSIVRQRVTL